MKKTIFITAVLCALIAPSTGSSCALHTSSITGLQVSHPSSITVSLATRKALSTGTVSSIGRPGTHDKLQNLEQIVNSFHAFGQVAEGLQSARGDFAVYLTESRLWTRFTGSENGWQVEYHLSDPNNDDTVLVMSDTGLKGLFDETLSLDQAKQLRLLVAAGKEENTAKALQSFQEILGAYLQTDKFENATVASDQHGRPGQS